MAKKQALYNRVKQLVDTAPHMVVDRKDVENHKGWPYIVYEDLGLSKSDLKQLEKAGLAVSGYYPTNKGWFRHVILIRG